MEPINDTDFERMSEKERVFGENCVFGMMLREEGESLLCGWERINHLPIHRVS